MSQTAEKSHSFLLFETNFVFVLFALMLFGIRRVLVRRHNN